MAAPTNDGQFVVFDSTLFDKRVDPEDLHQHATNLIKKLDRLEQIVLGPDTEPHIHSQVVDHADKLKLLLEKKEAIQRKLDRLHEMARN